MGPLLYSVPAVHHPCVTATGGALCSPEVLEVQVLTGVALRGTAPCPALLEPAIGGLGI